MQTQGRPPVRATPQAANAANGSRALHERLPCCVQYQKPISVPIPIGSFNSSDQSGVNASVNGEAFMYGDESMAVREIHCLREDVSELRQVLDDVHRKQVFVLQKLGDVDASEGNIRRQDVKEIIEASAANEDDLLEERVKEKNDQLVVLPDPLENSSPRGPHSHENCSNSGGHRKTIRNENEKHQLFGSMNADSSTLDQEVYDVSMYYYDTGVCQLIARSDLFKNVTLAIIGINTIYIGVDADRNPANIGGDPTLPFVICDYLFCSFFTFEWVARFGSFRRKRDSLKDMWFRFDTALVALMVWETWAMPLLTHFKVFGESGGAGGGGPVGMIKMLRLLRLARMARLMRAFPELIAMIKGVRVAAKAVGSALLMLLLLIYTFAIIMFMQLRGNSMLALASKFETLGNSMWTMLCDGVFLDSFGTVSFALLNADKYLEVIILVLFVLASNLTVMNMLIGVLCEVVSAVAAAEKEDSAIKLMKETLLVMLRHLDEDDSGMISKHEIEKVLDDVEAKSVLASLEVDVTSLVEQLEMEFSTTVEISIQEVMNFILMLRGDRNVTVKDMTHGQGVTRWRLREVRRDVATLNKKFDVLMGVFASNTVLQKSVSRL